MVLQQPKLLKCEERFLCFSFSQFFHLFLLTSIQIKVLTNNCHVANTCNYVAMFVTFQTFFGHPFLGVMQIFKKAHLFLLFSCFVLKNKISVCRKSIKICYIFTIKAQKRVPHIYLKRSLFLKCSLVTFGVLTHDFCMLDISNTTTERKSL